MHFIDAPFSSLCHHELINCLLLLFQVIGVGVFEVKLREIWNPGGRRMDKNCCSGSDLNGVCSSPCSTFFYTCLRQYPRPAHPADCTYGHNTSRVYKDNSFVLTSDNAVRFPFTANWPVGKTLTIKTVSYNWESRSTDLDYSEVKVWIHDAIFSVCNLSRDGTAAISCRRV
jgi:hypothetical protein